MNGQAFAFHYALPVDSAGELPGGQPFRDVRELKRLLDIGGDEFSVDKVKAGQQIGIAGGKVAECLEQHVKELSPDCKEKLAEKGKIDEEKPAEGAPAGQAPAEAAAPGGAETQTE